MEPKPHHPKTSSLAIDGVIEKELKEGRVLESTMDMRKLRRTISNRLSAQRSRFKTNKRIHDLEKTTEDLQELITILTPRVKTYKETNDLLQLQNDSLLQQLTDGYKKSRLRGLELEEKKKEVKELEEEAASNTIESSLKKSGEKEVIVKSEHELIKAAAKYPTIEFYKAALEKMNKKPLPEGPKSGPKAAAAADSVTGQAGGNRPKNAAAAARGVGEAEDIDQYINFEALNADAAGSNGQN